MDRRERCSSWRTSGEVAWGDSARRKQKGQDVDRVEGLRIAWAVAWHGPGRRESGGWPPSGCRGRVPSGGTRARRSLAGDESEDRRPGAGAGEKVSTSPRPHSTYPVKYDPIIRSCSLQY